MKELELRRNIIKRLKNSVERDHRYIRIANQYKIEKKKYKFPAHNCICCQRQDCKHSKPAFEVIAYSQTDFKMFSERYKNDSYILKQLQKVWGPDLTNGLKDK